MQLLQKSELASVVHQQLSGLKILPSRHDSFSRCCCSGTPLFAGHNEAHQLASIMEVGILLVTRLL